MLKSLIQLYGAIAIAVAIILQPDESANGVKVFAAAFWPVYFGVIVVEGP